MAVESATTINQLDQTKPGINDLKSEGDDHIRLLKSTIKNTLPNLTGPVTATQAELNRVVGVSSPLQAQIDAANAARIAGDDAANAARIAGDEAANAARIAGDDAANAARIAGDADLEARKADINGETYTGVHNFTGAAVSVAAPTSANHAATKMYADGLAFLPVLPGQAGNAGKFISTDGTTAFWKVGLNIYSYDNRAALRALSPTAGDAAVVEGLGLFVFAAGSTEPDDDESCFATASGRWLLEAAHWDLVDSWQAPDDQVIEDFQEDEPLRFASSFASRVLTGSATCAITSVASVSSASFTGAVTGAATGDRVIATPPAQLGDSVAATARLSYHAWVSAANTVTVMLTNASASAANTNPAIRAAWPLTVIKP